MERFELKRKQLMDELSVCRSRVAELETDRTALQSALSRTRSEVACLTDSAESQRATLRDLELKCQSLEDQTATDKRLNEDVTDKFREAERLYMEKTAMLTKTAADLDSVRTELRQLRNRSTKQNVVINKFLKDLLERVHSFETDRQRVLTTSSTASPQQQQQSSMMTTSSPAAAVQLLRTPNKGGGTSSNHYSGGGSLTSTLLGPNFEEPNFEDSAEEDYQQRRRRQNGDADDEGDDDGGANLRGADVTRRCRGVILTQEQQYHQQFLRPEETTKMVRWWSHFSLSILVAVNARRRQSSVYGKRRRGGKIRCYF